MQLRLIIIIIILLLLLWVGLTCVLRTHVKKSKKRNISILCAFNSLKH